MARARPAKPGELNWKAVDQFTALHVISGAVMGKMGMEMSTAFLLGAGWEVAEVPLKKNFPSMFPSETYDSGANKIVDIAAVMAGWWLGDRLNGRR